MVGGKILAALPGVEKAWPGEPYGMVSFFAD